MVLPNGPIDRRNHINDKTYRAAAQKIPSLISPSQTLGWRRSPAIRSLISWIRLVNRWIGEVMVGRLMQEAIDICMPATLIHRSLVPCLDKGGGEVIGGGQIPPWASGIWQIFIAARGRFVGVSESWSLAHSHADIFSWNWHAVLSPDRRRTGQGCISFTTRDMPPYPASDGDVYIYVHA
jgi:hypothetical protein